MVSVSARSAISLVAIKSDQLMTWCIPLRLPRCFFNPDIPPDGWHPESTSWPFRTATQSRRAEP